MPRGWNDRLIGAGPITALLLDRMPAEPLVGRVRHAYGHGPFAGLRMPALPAAPGVYVWSTGETPLYVGQTRGTLRARLGPNGYSRISTYNTFAREPGRTNGGQQTNCRINALANERLRAGDPLSLWFMVTEADEALGAEAEWMTLYGLPPWNRHDRR
jgi:hypothetical protein